MVYGPNGTPLHLQCNENQHVLLVHNVGYMCPDTSGIWSEQTPDDEASKIVIPECNKKRECTSTPYRDLKQSCEMRVQYVCIKSKSCLLKSRTMLRAVLYCI